MADLQSFNAKLCYIATGILVHENRVLLIKHKKLQTWLSPGGHIEWEELPHKAAEREFQEETGVPVQAFDPFVENWQAETEYLPSPILTNLHWVAKENYDARLKSDTPQERVPTELWARGCEQHLGLIYLVRPTGSLEFTRNEEETDDIGWFDADGLEEIAISPDVKREHMFALALMRDVDSAL